MRRFRLVSLLSVLPLITAGPAHALFHFAHISELHTQVDGDGGQQYLEIEMEAILQDQVANSVLHAWDCSGSSLGDLLVVPSNVANAGNTVKWLMATTSPIGGITPDFVIPSAGMPVGCGQVCWGAPGLLPPADPDSWDHTLPGNYVDCLAYGGYTGSTRLGSGTPTSLAPTTESSLTLISDTNDNATDFALGCPTPENNSGLVGGCGVVTTTSVTSTTSSTTTTTLGPMTIDQPLEGTKLVLKTKPERPEKSKLVLVAKDRALSIGAGPGSPEDPTSAGGAFVISSGSPGGAFTGSHTLTGEWKILGKPEAAKGYKWKSKTSAVRLLLVKNGKLLKVKAAGANVGFDLDDDPNPVRIEVRLGVRRYCVELGGSDPKFKEGKKYVAKKAPAPGACP